MKKNKRIGSFYTPKIIANFLVDYVSSKLSNQKEITILEPSAGDGIFIKTVYKHQLLSSKVKSIIAVEQSKRELNKILKEVKECSFTAIQADFLEFQRDNNHLFSLVIGNPPYIKNNLLKNSQVRICKSIHENARLSDNNPKNIWTSFLIRSIKFTDKNGIMAFVLPSELLQVKFAAELRDLILREFERVEIFTFNELLFKDCKGQDTLLLIAERNSDHKGIFYCNVEKLTDLENRKFNLIQSVIAKESKWTYHHLDSEEIELLQKLKSKLNTIEDYCNSKAGIVTAANDFFIVDEKTVEKYSLHNFIKPIIQKGIYVNGSINLTKEEFQMLIDDSKPTYLIAIDKNSFIRRNAKLWNYLNIGLENNINKRYKTLRRNKWYEVPNVGVAPDAFFFKRCNEYPKLIKNSANVLSTDSAYLVTMKDNYNVDSLIFSFYNSLTLSFAELSGRYYGGGVLELTPNEFKTLPIPYFEVGTNDFISFSKDFKNKLSIHDICKKNDAFLLKTIDRDIDTKSIQRVFRIREKLSARRIKT